jgi:hypothetical protein
MLRPEVTDKLLGRHKHLFDILAVLKQSNVALLAPVYNKRDRKREKLQQYMSA